MRAIVSFRVLRDSAVHVLVFMDVVTARLFEPRARFGARRLDSLIVVVVEQSSDAAGSVAPRRAGVKVIAGSPPVTARSRGKSCLTATRRFVGSMRAFGTSNPVAVMVAPPWAKRGPVPNVLLAGADLGGRRSARDGLEPPAAAKMDPRLWRAVSTASADRGGWMRVRMAGIAQLTLVRTVRMTRTLLGRGELLLTAEVLVAVSRSGAPNLNLDTVASSRTLQAHCRDPLQCD